MKTTFKEERAKLSDMNMKEKLQHIWEYYKIQIAGTLIAVLAVGTLVNIWFINPPAGTYLYIAWQGQPVMHESLDNLGDRLSQIVSDGNDQVVQVNPYILNPNDPEMFMGVQARLMGMITVGDLDLFIMDREGLYSNARGGLLRPACDMASALAETDVDLYNEINNRMVAVTFSPEEGQPPITDTLAISLYGSPLLESAGIHSDGLYLGMVANSNRFYEVSKALHMFMLQV